MYPIQGQLLNFSCVSLAISIPSLLSLLIKPEKKFNFLKNQLLLLTRLIWWVTSI